MTYNQTKLPKKEVTDKTKLNRLNKLLTYLRKLDREEPERFNLDTWIHSEPGFHIATAHREWPQRYKKGRPLNCGTSACVVGHLPVAFPNSWEWRRNYVVYKKLHNLPEYESMVEFFGGSSGAWRSVIYSDGYEKTDRCDDKGVTKIKLSSVIKRIEAIRDQLKKKV